MLIDGQVVNEENIETVVLPRPNRKLVFKFGPVIDFEEFDAICQLAKPPTVTKPGGKKEAGFDLPQYRETRMKYAEKKTAWMFLKSISYTPGLTFETVDMLKPETWLNYESELKAAKLTATEIDLLVQGFARANSMDSEHLEQEKESFLASLVEVEEDTPTE